MKKFLENIQKRDGRIVPFDGKKIEDAILRSARSVGKENKSLASRVTERVIHELKKKFGTETPTVENIQDFIEKELIDEGNVDIAKAVILYRNKRDEIRDSKSFSKKINSIVDDYVLERDWRVEENSNTSYSLSGLQGHISGAVIAEYVLQSMYPREISEAHREGFFHIHDASLGIAGYCCGWSLGQLLEIGFGGVEGRINAKPAKHLDAALGQMVNFMGTLQNEWAGAQAFSSFDTYLAPLAAKDNLTYENIKQSLQEFVFAINATSRWGNQVPFTNITLDWTVPEDMKEIPILYGGRRIEGESYGQFQNYMDMINKALIEVMLEGDSDGRVFTFPIPTYNITKEFDWNSENANLLFEMTAKYGLPYFQNFINSSLRPQDVRSMCCRLQINLKELANKTGGLFGSGEKTGSIGVVTINLPKIGYLSNTEEEFFERLNSLLYLAKESLEIKRKEVERNLERGLLPWTKHYLGSLKHHFCTIGIIGGHEACLNFLNKGIETPIGKKFMLKALDFIRKKLTEFQEETGHMYNLEATPAEGCNYRLAKIDKKKYPDIKFSKEGITYYTNSTHLPVDYSDSILDVIQHQEELQEKYTGGTVLHVFLGESMPSSSACKSLVKKIAYNSRLPYFTISPSFSVCPIHGYVKGAHEFCPEIIKEVK